MANIKKGSNGMGTGRFGAYLDGTRSSIIGSPRDNTKACRDDDLLRFFFTSKRNRDGYKYERAQTRAMWAKLKDRSSRSAIDSAIIELSATYARYKPNAR